MCTLQIVYFSFSSYPFFHSEKFPMLTSISLIDEWITTIWRISFLFFSPIIFKISSLRFPSFLSVCNVILNNYEGGKKDEEAHKKIELKLSTHIGFFSLFNSETILLTYLLLPAKQLHSHERKVSFKIFFFCVYLLFSPWGK